MDNNYAERGVRWAGLKTINWKEVYCIPNTYIFEILLQIVTVKIEALISGDKCLIACVKDLCRLWGQARFDTLYQLITIIKALTSQPVFKVRKQEVDARGEVKV
jgi:hypothetical protein